MSDGLESRIGPKLVAEFIGSAVLVIAAISPTILGYNVLKAGVALSVLYDGIAVAFVLFVLVELLGPVSGCHINPAVTVAMMCTKDIRPRLGCYYVGIQFFGGIVGMLATHLMFYHEVPTLITISSVARPQGSYLAEFLGTFMLVLVIYGCIRKESRFTSLAIGLLVGGFVITISSTMFANPQVTFARIFTYAIAGVRPLDAAIFVPIEIFGGVIAAYTAGYLFSSKRPE